MLSKTAFVLLGLLKEKPMNPYEIIKILDKLNISQWSPISSSAVYSTIHVLEQNGNIIGKKYKLSAMPEKTVYTVTKEGEKNFLASLEDYMKKDLRDITRFNLGTLFLCHFEKDAVINILKDRIENIRKNIDSTQSAYEEYKKQLIPEFVLISLTHNLTFYRSEMELVKIALQQIEKAKNWNFFLTSMIEG